MNPELPQHHVQFAECLEPGDLIESVDMKFTFWGRVDVIVDVIRVNDHAKIKLEKKTIGNFPVNGEQNGSDVIEAIKRSWCGDGLPLNMPQMCIVWEFLRLGAGF